MRSARPLHDGGIAVHIVHAGASLQAVLNAASPGDEIRLANGTYTGSGDSVLDVKKNVTIRALSPGHAVLDGQGSRRGIRIFRSCTVRLEGLVLTGGHTLNGGGLFATDGNVWLTSCTITGNSAGVGGGIFVSGAQTVVTITSSSIHQNSASPQHDGDHELYGLGSGGGQYIQGGTVINTHTSIHSNSAPRSGANVYATRWAHVCTWPNTISAVWGAISQCSRPPPYSPPSPPSLPDPPATPSPLLAPPLPASRPPSTLPLVAGALLALAIAMCLVKLGTRAGWRFRRWGGSRLLAQKPEVLHAEVLHELAELHHTTLALPESARCEHGGSSTVDVGEVRT